MSETLTIVRPDDWHVHFRSGKMLAQVAPYTARHFGRAVVMPNTLPKAILTADDIIDYREEILAATSNWPHFTPVMSLKLTMDTTAEDVTLAAAAGAKNVKGYPTNATTNSEEGIDITQFGELSRRGVFAAMVAHGMVFSLHAEHPKQPVFEREPYTIPFIKELMELEPKLKIVIEHVSTGKMAQFVASHPNHLAATVTAHHLLLTQDDLQGGDLQPHYHCKPAVKFVEDISQLWWYIKFSPNFFFGSDSAPHDRNTKESCNCKSGVFTAPLMLPLLAHLFEQHEMLKDVFEGFVSLRGAAYYGFEPNADTITLQKTDQPLQVSGPVIPHYVVPMPMPQGEEIYWHLVE